MKITTTTTFEEIDKVVFYYLENKKRVNKESFERLAVFGIKATDLLKYFNNGSITEKWGAEFTDRVYDAIERIYERCIIDFPVIPELSEIDIFIGKMFARNGWWSLCTTEFFSEPVKIDHVIKYLQRDKEIYTWNADFVYSVQREYAKAKEYLSGDEVEQDIYFQSLRIQGFFEK